MDQDPKKKRMDGLQGKHQEEEEEDSTQQTGFLFFFVFFYFVLLLYRALISNTKGQEMVMAMVMLMITWISTY